MNANEDRFNAVTFWQTEEESLKRQVGIQKTVIADLKSQLSAYQADLSEARKDVIKISLQAGLDALVIMAAEALRQYVYDSGWKGGIPPEAASLIARLDERDERLEELETEKACTPIPCPSFTEKEKGS